MTIAAWLTMLVVCGFVWGGFGTLLLIALKKERRKASTAELRTS